MNDEIPTISNEAAIKELVKAGCPMLYAEQLASSSIYGGDPVTIHDDRVVYVTNSCEVPRCMEAGTNSDSEGEAHFCDEHWQELIDEAETVPGA